MTKILHSGDLHGEYEKLFAHQDFDGWVDTGDFFPDLAVKDHSGLMRPAGLEAQINWFRNENLDYKLTRWLDGRPGISLPGNHDFAHLPSLLRCMVEVGHKLPVINLFGLTFAGFREIPWVYESRIRWPGESHDLTPYISRAFSKNPDVLLTHTPPGGILDLSNGEHFGSSILNYYLNYKEHKIKHHFFGHIHHSFGKIRINDVDFINGSCQAIIHEI